MNYRSLFRLLTVGMVLLVFLLAWLLWRSHDTAVQRTINDADNLAQALEGQFSATLRRMEATLSQIAARTPPQALHLSAVPRHQQAMEAMLRPYKTQFPELRDIFVYGPDGGILYDTLAAPRVSGQGNIAQRPAFIHLKNDPAATIAFSDLVRGMVSGQLTVATYVPVRDAQRRLIGVITASLRLEYFEQMFEALRLTPGSAVVVRSSVDHKLVIRHPWIESEFNKSVVSPIQRRIDAGEMHGIERFSAVTDGEFRLYGFRKLEAYPFYVAAGLAERAALAEWWRHVLLVGVSLLLVLTAIGVGLWLARREEGERQLARRQAAQAQTLMQEAMDSVPVGMIIYDQQDHFAMCNQAMRRSFSRMVDTLDASYSYEGILRAGLRRGAFPSARGQEDAWLADRLERHRVADGEPFELELERGGWVQFSEHRTPSGYIVGMRFDITERKRLESELRQQANTDALTGLPNRRYFLQRLDEELERVRRRVTPQACVLMLDLDHFKRINDSHGHAAGDQVLRHFANLLRQELRGTDMVGRLGGEEFAAILPGSDAQAAQFWAQRICTRLADEPLLLESQTPVAVTVSVGVAALQAGDPSADSVLSRADKALYQAKQDGRNRVALADLPA